MLVESPWADRKAGVIWEGACNLEMLGVDTMRALELPGSCKRALLWTSTDDPPLLLHGCKSGSPVPGSFLRCATSARAGTRHLQAQGMEAQG